jgi:serine/threonine protein kinase
MSLLSMLYAVTYSDTAAILKPSNIWRRMRSTESGRTSLRGLMEQLVRGVDNLHKDGIAHRDIKPSNILLNTETSARVSGDSCSARLGAIAHLWVSLLCIALSIALYIAIFVTTVA